MRYVLIATSLHYCITLHRYLFLPGAQVLLFQTVLNPIFPAA
jgi:hypothetical protein